jgi:hypothetical protein
MKFEDFKFEVIDIYSSGKPDIHITQNGITFTKKLIEDMGYPQYVVSELDPEKKVLAIKVCKADNLNSIPFSKPKAEQTKAIQLSAAAIRLMLRGLMSDVWQDKNRYYMTGYWFADAKAMLFDLTTAKELPPYQIKKTSDR